MLRFALPGLLAAGALTLAGCKTVRAPEASTTLADDAGGTTTGLTDDQRAQYQRYLQDTTASLEMMRGRTGLIKDSVWICWDQDLQRPNFMDTQQLTSPTNIGLDLILLTQRALRGGGDDAAQAKATLQKLVQTLSGLDYHHANGLFFRTYWPDTGVAEDIQLSSVDNLHLAYGLWVVGATFKEQDRALAQAAQQLFERMDFSDFYNTRTGLIGGNLRPVGEDFARGQKGDPQGDYKRDAFDYSYFGSEARSLYALGYALGLYRQASRQIPDFDQKLLGPAITGTLAEVETYPSRTGSLQLLRTWDGGGFQELLPAVLVREERYSPTLALLHRNYAQRLAADAADLGVPAAHSASAFGVNGLRLFRSGDQAFDKDLPVYNGAAGHVDMVATTHEDVRDPSARRYWDLAYTPHPALMAASFVKDPALARQLSDTFKQNETLASVSTCVCRQAEAGGNRSPAPRCECQSTADLPNMPAGPDGKVAEPNLCTADGSGNATDHLYQPGLGWMDGYYVRGPLKGRVVPVLISLDQAMIALALDALLSPDGQHVGSKALADDPVVGPRLRTAYQQIEDKLLSITASSGGVGAQPPQKNLSPSTPQAPTDAADQQP